MLAASRIVAFVGTVNQVQAKAFYCEQLGLKLVSEDNFALVFDAAGTMLRVTKVPKMDPAGYTVLGWAVEDIVSQIIELRQAGVRFEMFEGLPQSEYGIWTAPGGTQVAWFKDPDGNLLSLSQF